MKTLAFFLTATRIKNLRSGKASLFLQVFLLLVSVLCLYLAFQLHGFSHKTIVAAALAQADTTVALSSQAVAQTVTGVRNSLSLLARIPILRSVRQTGRFSESLSQLSRNFRLLADSYESELSSVLRRAINYRESLLYWGEMPLAGWRRLTFSLNLWRDDDAEAAEEDTGNLPAFAEMRQITGLTRTFIDAAVVKTSEIASVFLPVFSFGDNFRIFQQERSENAALVENLFAATMNDELIKALAMKSMSGETIVRVGGRVAENISRDNRDCRAIAAGSPFFAGPVAYDKDSRRAVWWVAVPIRDESRKPVACLSGLIDVGFLSVLSSILPADKCPELFFADHNHVIIGHRQSSLVAQQVKVSAVTESADAPRPAWRVISRVDGRFLQVIKNLKDLEFRHLPAWNIYVNAEMLLPWRSGQILLQVCVILLAAVGMIVLSCCVVRIFIIMNGEN